MSDKPFTAFLNEQHSKARWPCNRLAVFHPGKLVKAGDEHRIITEDECVSFTNRILVSISL